MTAEVCGGQGVDIQFADVQCVGEEPGGEGSIALFVDAIHFRQLADGVESAQQFPVFHYPTGKGAADTGDFLQGGRIGCIQFDERPFRELLRPDVWLVCFPCFPCRVGRATFKGRIFTLKGIFVYPWM